MTALAEPETVEVGTSDPSKVSHFVKKRVHADAYIFGAEVEALCGHRFVPTQNPEKLPVCPPCKTIFEDDGAREQIGKYL